MKSAYPRSKTLGELTVGVSQSQCFVLLTAVLIPAEEGGFVALNPETGSTTQGESVPEAIANLREATNFISRSFLFSLRDSHW